MQKKIVYQAFARLFGNTNTINKPWGTIAENGVGKCADFTHKALQEIKNLGVTHIWFTGVLHHAVIHDYTPYGISNDHPDVVKGRAGSPYAIKDYYNIDPDLAKDPANRLNEFKELIARVHDVGLEVIIDIVPNHVARHYESKSNPPGVRDFGADDDVTVAYKRDNNFYYNPGECFTVPQWLDNYLPLNGEKNPEIGKFTEIPAKWTGNGSRLSQPGFFDWYETVKLNYGVRPDGTNDFEDLPPEYSDKGFREHFAFWQQKNVPDTWLKFRDIALYWIRLGVDGFRYDMAEMVPVAFWSFMNSAIKTENPDTFLLAEVYNPALYRDYIFLGKMDYLYDKVEMYDTLKEIMQGHGNTDNIMHIQNGMSDIEHQMLHFLENHDEHRIASPSFCGSAIKGKPAMVLSATISTSPTMIYFGQEVGEPAVEKAGFGSCDRTSIFDYIGVPHHQRWVNNLRFDGGQLTTEEKDLRDFYQRLLNFTLISRALMGKYLEIHGHNRAFTPYYNHHIYTFVRYSNEEQLIIVINFHSKDTFGFDMEIPNYVIENWSLQNDGHYLLVDQLYHKASPTLFVNNGLGKVRIDINPLESFILKIMR